MTARPVSTATTNGAVAVTPHHLASEAAIGVMAAGGNAVDGIVAANAVLGMVLPTTCGIGGDLFALIHLPGTNAPLALNASGRGGSGLDPAALRAAGHAEMPLFSPAAVTVPGCVDGWLALLEELGSRPLAAVLEPAIRLGTEGFPVSPEFSAALGRIESLVKGQESAPALYPNGAVPDPGTVLRRPRLAALLEQIGSEGRDAFYSGAVAAAVCAATRGILDPDDLRESRPDWIDPIGIDVFGRRFWTIPPNSQGYLTGAALWLLEQLGPPADPTEPAFHHAVIEAYRAVAWERDRLVADPGRLPLPAADLLDPERLRPRLGRIDPERASVWPDVSPLPGGTAYLCAIDSTGMGVSLIQSNFTGIGSGISAGDTGVWLHNRGAGFSLETGHPNEAAPGMRPLHTLSPTLWTRGGRLELLLGTRGGHQQPQYLAQTAAQLFHCSLDPATAQGEPRWEMAHAAAGSGSVVSVEARMPEGIVVGLGARGHAVTKAADYPAGWGPVSIVLVDADGTRRAAADPRVSTAQALAH